MRFLDDFERRLDRAPRWSLAALGGLVALAIAVAVHYPFLGDFFALDDFIALYQVEKRDLATLLRDAFALPQDARFERISPFWRPMGLLYFDFTHAAFGLEPAPYHVVNVLLHGLNAVLLAVLVALLSRSAFAAASAAIVFAVLPTYDIAVLWISQGFELLAVAFGLASLTLFALYVRHRGSRRLLYAAAIVTALLALMAKESSPFLLVMLFPMFVVLEGWPDIRSKALKPLAPLVPFGLLLGLYTLFIVVQEHALGTSSHKVGTHIVDNLQFYLRWMTLPIPYTWGSWVEAASHVTAVLLLSGILFAVATGRTLVVFFAVWMLVALLPVLPFATGVELRYTYIPSLGLAAMAGLAIDAARRWLGRVRFRWANLVTIVGVLVLAVFLSTRARDQQHWLHAQASLLETFVEDVGAQCGTPLPRSVLVLNSPIPDPYDLRLRSAVNIYYGGSTEIEVTRFEGASLPVTAASRPDGCALAYRDGRYHLAETISGTSGQ